MSAMTFSTQGKSGGLSILLAGVALLMLSSCASHRYVYGRAGDPPAPLAEPAIVPERSRTASSPRAAEPIGERAARVAVSMLGTPYRYGGSTPRGFDCSGLVQYAYRRVGLDVPRTTGQQWEAAEEVRLREAQPGDVLFFRIGRKVSHVGIYLGDGGFVHAPETGRTVELASLDNEYYRARVVRAGRLH